MGKKEKLVQRFLSKPKDFTYDELISLLRAFGYEERKSGHAGGSRATFYNKSTKSVIKMHRPHPDNKIKAYVLDQIEEELKRLGVMP